MEQGPSELSSSASQEISHILQHHEFQMSPPPASIVTD